MNIYTQRQRFKQLIVVTAVLIGIGSLWYTRQLVDKLATEEHKKVELWAKATENLASNVNPNTDFSFVFGVNGGSIVVEADLSAGQVGVGVGVAEDADAEAIGVGSSPTN